MIKLIVNGCTYYINVNLITYTKIITEQEDSDDDNDFENFNLIEVGYGTQILKFKLEDSNGGDVLLQILEGLTLRIQPVSPIAQLPQTPGWLKQ